MSQSISRRLLSHVATALTAACLAVLAHGCATAPAALGPLSGLQEAKTRAQVERQAARDPFPSPGDVGLK